MKRGYGVFGKAYEIMLRNDLHDIHSIDHKLMHDMVLLDSDSYQLLYSATPSCPDMRSHNLYDFAQDFKGLEDYVSIRNILAFTSKIAKDFSLPFEEMQFGGTEKEILNRGTDWCADMARVAVVLLNGIGIPARLVYLANPERAYSGHVIAEAFYEDRYGTIDPIYGHLFYAGAPLDAYALMNEPQHLKNFREEYRSLFRAIAISEYNPVNPSNDYSISKVNDYYRTLLEKGHNGVWVMGEDDNETL